LDAVGTAEAIDVSLALVANRKRIVTIAAPERARTEGIVWIVGSIPSSNQYRDAQRSRLLQLASEGLLEVPVGATYPLEEAPEAVAALMGHHPYGKLALVT
jgi:NADPH:quinone reductase-like Zn-dependent oxidoreductase